MSTFEPERVPILSIEQQWKMVDRWREALTMSAGWLPRSSAPANLSVGEAVLGEPSQALADLEHAWQSIDKRSYFPSFLDRSGRFGDTPIESVSAYVRAGLYPPPELLLAVGGSFESYVDARGEVGLEEAFFGRPKRRAGNYAAQKAASFDELRWAMLVSSRDNGKTDLEAAEDIVRSERLEIDPESLLRRARRRWRRLPKSEK